MKPEARFVSNVNKYLPAKVHHQSMAFTFTNGTPDQYYDGETSDLWVEYKWYARRPGIFIPKLTALQLQWLKRRQKVGKNAWVIVGWPSEKNGRPQGISLIANFEHSVNTTSYNWLDCETLAYLITEQTCHVQSPQLPVGED